MINYGYRLPSSAIVFAVAALSFGGDEPRTTGSNLIYRTHFGDIGTPFAAPVETRRHLRIAAGAEELLELCQTHPEQWSQDSLINRFGHSHSFTTIGCRERGTPSMHIVFYLQP